MKAKLADVFGRERTLGSAPWFVLSGPFVKHGPDGAVLAEHADAFWIRDDQHFHELVFVEPARVRIETGSEPEAFGPFDRVMAADGVLYGDGQYLAKLAPDGGRWHVAASGVFARDLVIEPASS